jgi:hypothetical protein
MIIFLHLKFTVGDVCATRHFESFALRKSFQLIIESDYVDGCKVFDTSFLEFLRLYEFVSFIFETFTFDKIALICWRQTGRRFG